MGLSRQDRTRILADPLAAYRDRRPQTSAGTPEDLQRLHDEYTALRQQCREKRDETRRLSRKIGTAKRNGEAIDGLLAAMQAQSRELKNLETEKQQTEAGILAWFNRTAPDSPPPAAAGPAITRYPAHAEPVAEPDIGPLDDQTGAWNTYVDNHPAASIYHRAEWRQVIRQTFGHDCPGFLARDRDRKIIGVLPLVHLRSRLFGNFMVSMPYFNYGGALADHPQTEQQLMEAANTFARENGMQHVEYRDTLPREGLPGVSRKVCMLLPLPGEHETLWQGFPAKLRAQIRRPQREHPAVRCGGLECLDDFYAVFSRNMRDLGTPVYPREFFANILQTFTEQSRIISVRLHDRPVAAGFLLGYRGQLEIPWASTLREVNHLSMNMLLYWEVLKFAIERGYRQFDFGRSSPGSGTFRFKQQWGAQPLPLHWHYWLRDGGEPPELNPDNPKYALAIGTWKRLPLGVANRLGPAIVKYLP